MASVWKIHKTTLCRIHVWTCIHAPIPYSPDQGLCCERSQQHTHQLQWATETAVSYIEDVVSLGNVPWWYDDNGYDDNGYDDEGDDDEGDDDEGDESGNPPPLHTLTLTT